MLNQIRYAEPSNSANDPTNAVFAVGAAPSSSVSTSAHGEVDARRCDR